MKWTDGFRVAYLEHAGPWNEIGLSFRQLLRLLWLRRLWPSGPLMAIYGREPKNGKTPTHIEVAAPVRSEARPGGGLRMRDLDPCDAACLVYDGPPARYPESLEALNRWVKRHGYVRAGPIREIYARDPSDLPPGIMYAEVQVPVRPRRPRRPT